MVASDPKGELAAAYVGIAERLVAKLQQLAAGQPGVPKISVEE